MKKILLCICTVIFFFICLQSSSARSINASITDVEWPTGDWYPGESIEVSVYFKNTGDVENNFWVGFSVIDASGGWWDIPAKEIDLDPGGESGWVTLAWVIPYEASTGGYSAEVALWEGYNSNTDTMIGMLDSRTKDDSFFVLD